LVEFLNEGVAGEGRNFAKEVVRLILPVGYGTVNRCIVLCLKKTDEFGFDGQIKQGRILVLLLIGGAGAEEGLVYDRTHGLLARSCGKRNNRPEKWCQPARGSGEIGSGKNRWLLPDIPALLINFWSTARATNEPSAAKRATPAVQPMVFS